MLDLLTDNQKTLLSRLVCWVVGASVGTYLAGLSFWTGVFIVLFVIGLGLFLSTDLVADEDDDEDDDGPRNRISRFENKVSYKLVRGKRNRFRTKK